MLRVTDEIKALVGVDNLKVELPEVLRVTDEIKATEGADNLSLVA